MKMMCGGGEDDSDVDGCVTTIPWWISFTYQHTYILTYIHIFAIHGMNSCVLGWLCLDKSGYDCSLLVVVMEVMNFGNHFDICRCVSVCVKAKNNIDFLEPTILLMPIHLLLWSTHMYVCLAVCGRTLESHSSSLYCLTSSACPPTLLAERHLKCYQELQWTI